MFNWRVRYWYPDSDGLQLVVYKRAVVISHISPKPMLNYNIQKIAFTQFNAALPIYFDILFLYLQSHRRALQNEYI